ncbi:MAG: shikimate kinase [Bacteroidota bacterium]
MHSFNKKVFLVGMPGSGKSTLGQELAESLHVEFFDLDHEIERVEQKSIPEIFELHGEEYFRKVESDNLQRLADFKSGRGLIIATGGGTPCFMGNMKIMNQTGIAIFLDVSLHTLTERLMATDLSSRPKFGDDKGLIDRLQHMHSERIPDYNKATFTIKGDDTSLDDLIKVIESA